MDQVASQKCYETTIAEWNYATNINSGNEKIKLEANLELAKFNKEVWKNVTNSPFRLWKNFKDQDLVRMLKKLTVLGPAALPEDEYRQVNFQFQILVSFLNILIS